VAGPAAAQEGVVTRILVDVEVQSGHSVSIAGDELHYLSAVRRHRVGDEVLLHTPAGRVFRGAVSSVGKERADMVVAEELAPAAAASPVRILCAVPKGNIFDDVIRQLSELGVERLTPVACAHSTASPGEARLDRWRRIAKESIRQCRRRTPLIVDDVTGLADALRDAQGIRVMFHPGEGRTAAALLQSRIDGPVIAAIGPEGGFSGDEVQLALDAGFEAVCFSNLILRIETAAVAAAVLCVAITGGIDR